MTSMIAPKGTYLDPTLKHCWQNCTSCGRCKNKGSRAACNSCSGRVDPEGKKVPCVDDYCRCAEGILQWVTTEGKLLQVRLKSNPYAGTVKYEKQDEDEADWESYVHDMREKYDNPNWDPVQFTDGSSTLDWTKGNRGL